MNYDDEDALYNDYKCPTKDELPIILRVTLPPCAVFHLISEYITFLRKKYFNPASDHNDDRHDIYLNGINFTLALVLLVTNTTSK